MHAIKFLLRPCWDPHSHAQQQQQQQRTRITVVRSCKTLKTKSNKTPRKWTKTMVSWKCLHSSQSKARQNKNVWSYSILRLKQFRLVTWRMFSGRAFHACGPA